MLFITGTQLTAYIHLQLADETNTSENTPLQGIWWFPLGYNEIPSMTLKVLTAYSFLHKHISVTDDWSDSMPVIYIHIWWNIPAAETFISVTYFSALTIRTHTTRRILGWKEEFPFHITNDL